MSLLDVEFIQEEQFRKDHLTGNHDYHYLKYVYQTYNGFQAFEQPKIQPLIQSAYKNKLLQIAYTWRYFLFTHAGLTKEWSGNNFREDHIIFTRL